MSGPNLSVSLGFSLMIASWLHDRCPTLNITSMFMTGRKGRVRSQQVHATWACFPFKEAFLQTPPKNFSFNLLTRTVPCGQRVAAHWVTSMKQRRAFPRQIDHTGEKCCIKHFPSCFFLSFNYKAYFFALPLKRSSVFKTFRNIHSDNNLREWNQNAKPCGADSECSKSQREKWREE